MQIEHIIIASMTTGFATFWAGFFLRKLNEQPAYSRMESDAVLNGLTERMDHSDERLERIENKLDHLIQNGRGHAAG